MAKAPLERSRMYFLLAWMHAVVQERLRYVPVGWSKKYEFGDPDLRSAIDTIDIWIENVAGGRYEAHTQTRPLTWQYEHCSRENPLDCAAGADGAKHLWRPHRQRDRPTLAGLLCPVLLRRESVRTRVYEQ